MKRIIVKILERVLRALAIRILRKYKPDIVGVTGSVGKTSTKEAIHAVLSTTYRVRSSEKSFNNELGIPLTIIGARPGGRSVARWLGVIGKALRILATRTHSYPDILVLEMGADHPNDIGYLTEFLPLRVGVVTSVAPVHLEFFSTLDQVAKEKAKLIKELPKDGYAILNGDDRLVADMAKRTKAKVITFGLQSDANIRASEIAISHEVNYKDISTIQGVSFKLSYLGSTVPVLLPKVLGQHMAYSALAAAGVGVAFNLNLVTIASGLRGFEPPAGRMRLLKGIKQTLIIDDTYNASPFSVRAALWQLRQLNLPAKNRKFAVLGDMRELGGYTEEAHREIGEAVAEYKIDILVTAGEMARDIVRAAVAKGVPEDHCFSFADSGEAGKFVQQRIKSGDLILVKGSRVMRMEQVVKEVMVDPERAKELLVN